MADWREEYELLEKETAKINIVYHLLIFAVIIYFSFYINNIKSDLKISKEDTQMYKNSLAQRNQEMIKLEREIQDLNDEKDYTRDCFVYYDWKECVSKYIY